MIIMIGKIVIVIAIVIVITALTIWFPTMVFSFIVATGYRIAKFKGHIINGKFFIHYECPKCRKKININKHNACPKCNTNLF